MLLVIMEMIVNLVRRDYFYKEYNVKKNVEMVILVTRMEYVNNVM